MYGRQIYGRCGKGHLIAVQAGNDGTGGFLDQMIGIVGEAQQNTEACLSYDISFGGLALTRALCVLDQNITRFMNYKHSEVLPAVYLGYELPLIDGFARYLESTHSRSPVIRTMRIQHWPKGWKQSRTCLPAMRMMIHPHCHL